MTLFKLPQFMCVLILILTTVLKAHGLLIKGRNGTNNCFVTIALGKNTFKTSQRDKATENVEWFEECEL